MYFRQEDIHKIYLSTTSTIERTPHMHGLAPTPTEGLTYFFSINGSCGLFTV